MTTTETTNRYEQFAPPANLYGANTLHMLRDDLANNPPVGAVENRQAAAMLLRHAAHQSKFTGGDALGLATMARAHLDLARECTR